MNNLHKIYFNSLDKKNFKSECKKQSTYLSFFKDLIH